MDNDVIVKMQMNPASFHSFSHSAFRRANPLVSVDPAQQTHSPEMDCLIPEFIYIQGYRALSALDTTAAHRQPLKFRVLFVRPTLSGRTRFHRMRCEMGRVTPR